MTQRVSSSSSQTKRMNDDLSTGLDNEKDMESERDFSEEEEEIDSEFFTDIDFDFDDDDSIRAGSYLGEGIPPPLPLCSFEPDEVTNSKPRSIAGFGIRTIDFKGETKPVASSLHDPLRCR